MSDDQMWTEYHPAMEPVVAAPVNTPGAEQEKETSGVTAPGVGASTTLSAALDEVTALLEYFGPENSVEQLEFKANAARAHGDPQRASMLARLARHRRCRQQPHYLRCESADDVLRLALRDRRDVGIDRYGEPLMTHNGRDARVDLAQELLDSLAYTHQLALEACSDHRSDVMNDLIGQLDPGAIPPSMTRWWRLVQELVPLALDVLHELDRDQAHEQRALTVSPLPIVVLGEMRTMIIDSLGLGPWPVTVRLRGIRLQQVDRYLHLEMMVQDNLDRALMLDEECLAALQTLVDKGRKWMAGDKP